MLEKTSEEEMRTYGEQDTDVGKRVGRLVRAMILVLLKWRSVSATLFRFFIEEDIRA